MVQNTHLDFIVFDTFNCKTLGIIDTSYYNPLSTISGNTLQILVPGYSDPIELSYNQSGVTILNSNNLGVTNVADPELYLDLPDGPYVIKISICPNNLNWIEKICYRDCKIQCKYDRAILLLDLNKCETCYNADLAKKLQTAQFYIQGCLANARLGNTNKATELYNVANKLLDEIVECRCWNHKKENNIW